MENKTEIEIKLEAAKELKSFAKWLGLFILSLFITSIGGILTSIGELDEFIGIMILLLFGLFSFLAFISLLLSFYGVTRHIVNYYKHKLELQTKKH